MVWATMKMILGLGAVLFLLFLSVRFLKRTGIGSSDSPSDSWIRLLTTKAIAPHKYISLVEIGGEVLVVGIAESQMTLLHKVSDREVAAKMMASRAVRPEPLSWFSPWPLGRKGLRNRDKRAEHDQ